MKTKEITVKSSYTMQIMQFHPLYTEFSETIELEDGEDPSEIRKQTALRLHEELDKMQMCFINPSTGMRRESILPVVLSPEAIRFAEQITPDPEDTNDRTYGRS